MDNILYLSHKVARERLVVPRILVSKLLEATHDDKFASHLGVKRTTEKLTRFYFWPGMHHDIRNYCNLCLPCAQQKTPKQYVKAPLVPIPVAGAFDRVASDAVTFSTTTETRNKYVIVFTNYLTKYCEAIAVPAITAEATADAFLKLIVLRHGAPRFFLTDQGSNFNSSLVKEICRLCNTRKLSTTAYHPQTDGLVERFNKTLAILLSMYVNEHHTDWDVYLPFIVFTYNTSVQESTKYSPFALLYGREPQLPIDAILNFRPSPYQIDLDDYAHQTKKFFGHAWNSAKSNIQLAQTKQQENYNRKSTQVSFEIGDHVMCHSPVVTPGHARKFTFTWKGPFRVETIEMPNVTIGPIQAMDGAKSIKVHVNRLKPYGNGSSLVGTPTPLASVGSRPATAPAHGYNLRPRKF